MRLTVGFNLDPNGRYPHTKLSSSLEDSHVVTSSGDPCSIYCIRNPTSHHQGKNSYHGFAKLSTNIQKDSNTHKVRCRIISDAYMCSHIFYSN